MVRASRRWTKRAAAACVLACAATLRAADCPNVHIWQAPYHVAPDPVELTRAYAKRLSLDAAQERSVRAVLEASRRRWDVLAAKQDAEGQRLMELDRELREHNARFQALSKQLDREESDVRAQVRALIPPQRLTTFDEMEEERSRLAEELRAKECEEALRLKDPVRPKEAPGASTSR